MRIHRIKTTFFLLVSALASTVHSAEPPWVSLFDGKTLAGWQVLQGSAKAIDGQLVVAEASVLRCSRAWQNFDLTMEVRTEPGASGRISCGTYQTADEIANSSGGSHIYLMGFPSLEVWINNSIDCSSLDLNLSKTGTLGGPTGIRKQFRSVAQDGKWFKLRIWRQNYLSRVWVNGILLAEEPSVLDDHSPPTIEVAKGASISFKNLRLQELSDKAAAQGAGDNHAQGSADLHKLVTNGFPLINYHIHLKGDLTLEKALAHSRETGVFYGIAANCGLNFPITDDAAIYDYLKKMEGQPCFVGMQAEGREWPTLFSKDAIAKFDYIFTDAMTIVDHRGKRARLWIPEEVDIPDKQAFMELLVRTIEQILDNEPVDIYANPTYLPDMLIKEYDSLWTPERVKRVIDAAARNGVAIEISNRLKLPKSDFIRQAKKAGIKFSVGTNNVDSKLGGEEYALEMIRECKLEPSDMFLPKPDGKKRVQLRGFKGR
jgi:hypothetical protein